MFPTSSIDPTNKPMGINDSYWAEHPHAQAQVA